MGIHQIIVGNIGLVLATIDETEAQEIFSIYRRFSADGIGRAGYESVTWLEDDEPREEFLPEGWEDLEIID